MPASNVAHWVGWLTCAKRTCPPTLGNLHRKILHTGTVRSPLYAVSTVASEGTFQEVQPRPRARPGAASGPFSSRRRACGEPQSRSAGTTPSARGQTWKTMIAGREGIGLRSCRSCRPVLKHSPPALGPWAASPTPRGCLRLVGHSIPRARAESGVVERSPSRASSATRAAVCHRRASDPGGIAKRSQSNLAPAWPLPVAGTAKAFPRPSSESSIPITCQHRPN